MEEVNEMEKSNKKNEDRSDSPQPIVDVRGQQARWLSQQPTSIGQVIKKYRNEPAEMYHFLNYLGTNEQIKREGLRARKKDMLVLYQQAKRWIYEQIHPLQPPGDPVELKPLVNGAPNPGPRQVRHSWESYEFDRRDGVFHAGYLFYRITLETPYHLERKRGDKEIITISSGNDVDLRKNTATTLQHVFDWARSTGLLEDLLLETMKMALESEEARSRGSWNQVETGDRRTLQVLEEVELMDIQIRAMLKLIPPMYWPRMLRAPPGINSVWELEAYPRDRFQYILVPNALDRQLNERAKYVLTVHREIVPELPNVMLAKPTLQDKVNFISGSEGDPEANSEDERLVEDENEPVKQASEPEMILPNDPITDDTPKRHGRISQKYQMVPKSRKSSGLKTVDPEEEEADPQQSSSDSDDGMEGLDRISDRLKKLQELGNLGYEESEERTPRHECIPEPLKQLSVHVEDEPFPPNVTPIQEVEKQSDEVLENLREKTRRAEESARRVAEDIDRIEREAKEREEAARQLRTQTEQLAKQRAEEEYARKLRAEQKQREERDRIQKEEIDKREKERKEKEKERQRTEMVQPQEKEKAKENPEKEKNTAVKTTPKIIPRGKSRLTREREELEKFIDDKLQEIEQRKLPPKEKEKELALIQDLRDQQTKREQMMGSSLRMLNYATEHDKTQKRMDEVAEYAFDYEKNFNVTVEDIKRICNELERIGLEQMKINKLRDENKIIQQRRDLERAARLQLKQAQENQSKVCDKLERLRQYVHQHDITLKEITKGTLSYVLTEEEKEKVRQAMNYNNSFEYHQKMEEEARKSYEQGRQLEELEQSRGEKKKKTTIKISDQPRRPDEETDLEEVMSSAPSYYEETSQHHPPQRVMVRKNAKGEKRVMGRWYEEDVYSGDDTDTSQASTVKGRKIFIPAKISPMAE